MAKKKKMDKSNNEIILLDQDVRRDPDKHYPFDQEAQKIFNTLPARHKTHLKASEAITQAAGRISSGTETGRSALRNGLTYDQFLADLLYPEETMLVSQFISFNSVVFDEEPQSPPRSEMTSGRAFLTSRRLLLLSAEVHQGLKLEGVCYKQNKKPFGYTVAGMASDNLHFLSIPLTNIHSLELNVSVGVESAETVRGVKPRPCCLALCSCFGIDRCIKQWISTNQTPVLATNERVLIMGVTMPPWNNRYMTNIHLNAEVPLTLVKEYIVVLTRSAPNVVSQNTASA